MNLKQAKLELFYFRRASQHGKGLQYMYNRAVLEKDILKLTGSLQKNITRDDLSIHMLIGHAHTLMTVWALGSYYSVSDLIGTLYIHSDGTLTDTDQKILRHFFPDVTFVMPDDYLHIEKNDWLKNDTIRNFRKQYAGNFFLRKLTDPVFISDKKYILAFDCDILWFQHPTELADEIRGDGDRSFMMAGRGAGEKELTNTVFFKDGTSMAAKYSDYNGGIMFFQRENLPVHSLEDYFQKIDMANPLSYHFVEQSGYAYNLVNMHALPEKRYTITGEVSKEVVAKHYTGPRREFFYIIGLPMVKEAIGKLAQENSSIG